MEVDYNCCLCGKEKKDAKIIIEVALELFPKYVREDGSLETMNGLWKKSREFFCEECFSKYATTLENFYRDNINNNRT